ncbi:MAG: type II toxin-antitoxin system VapC family toxin [Chloroflexi bacterium]|nr:type II toxin-antitoxin system VapC family toxin [Chloroflexota bacterium]
MGVYILDSFALLAYLEDEAGAEQVEARLIQAEKGEAKVLLSLINYGECLYIVERERGLAQAQWTVGLVDRLPVQVVEVDRSLVLAAAHIKARYPIAYADAFAVALAQQIDGTLLTGDPEFRRVQGLIPIEWLPQRR